MNFIVFSPSHYLKIFWPIVLSIMIYVMNDFFSRKWSSKLFLHNIAMLPNILIIDTQENISSLNNLFPRPAQHAYISKLHALSGAIFETIRSRLRRQDYFSTSKALRFKQIFLATFSGMSFKVNSHAFGPAKLLNPDDSIGKEEFSTDLAIFSHAGSYHIGLIEELPQNVCWTGISH